VSLLWLFKKYVDPIAHRQEEEDHRRQRENLPPDADGSVGGEVILPTHERPARLHRCRVCHAEVQLPPDEPPYCTACLAETLEPVR
jgi:hypothetical protein